MLVEAARIRGEERGILAEVEQNRTVLEQAVAARQSAEAAHQEEERRVAGLQRAAADRREGLARLHGQVNALKSRAQAAADEIGRLRGGARGGAWRGPSAPSTTSPPSRPGSLGSTRVRRASTPSTRPRSAPSPTSRSGSPSGARKARGPGSASAPRSAARLEALSLGLSRKDGAGALLAATEQVSGLMGSVAALLTVQNGYESAVAAALGSAADAVAAEDADAAVRAIGHLKSEDLGRTGILLGGADVDDSTWPGLPSGAVYATDVVDCSRPAPPGAASAAVQGRRRRRPGCGEVAGGRAGRRHRGHPRRRPAGSLLRSRWLRVTVPSLLEAQAALRRDRGSARRGHPLRRAARLRAVPSRGGAVPGQAPRRRGAGEAPRVRRPPCGGRRGACPVRLADPLGQG